MAALKELVVRAARNHMISNALSRSSCSWRGPRRVRMAECLDFQNFLLDPVSMKTTWSNGTIDLIFVDNSGFGVVQVEPTVTRDTITGLLGTGEMMEERMKQARFSPYASYEPPFSELFIGGCVFDDDAKDFALNCGVNVVQLREDEWSVVRSSTSKGGCGGSSGLFMFSWRKGMTCKSSLAESDEHSFTRFLTTLQSGAQYPRQHHETSLTVLPQIFRKETPNPPSISCVDVSIDGEGIYPLDHRWNYYTGSINKGHFPGDPSTWKLGGHGRGDTSRGKWEGSDDEELEGNRQRGFSTRKEKCVTAIYRHLVEHRKVWVDLEDCEVDIDGNLFFVWKFMKPISIEAAESKGMVDLIYLAKGSVAVIQVEPRVTRESIGQLLGTRRMVEKRLDKASHMHTHSSAELFIGGCVFDDDVKQFALACGVSVVELLDEWPIVQSSISKGGHRRC